VGILEMASRVWLGVVSLISLVIAGCTSKPIGEPRVNVASVTGIVHVDGQPISGLIVECHTEPESSKNKRPIITRTDVKAKFCFTTYEYCDGLPEGSYSLVFKWQTPLSGQKDQLNGKYADPKKSKYLFTIADRQPKDLGIIELSAKGSTK
jgi:hypothetical protein